MKRLFRTQPIAAFIRNYKLFVFALCAAAVAGALQIAHVGIVGLVLALTAIIFAIANVVAIIQSVQAGRYGVNVLGIIAIVAALILQQYWVAMAVAIMLSGATVVEALAIRRARAELNALIKWAPWQAHILHRGGLKDAQPSDLHEGETIRILPGETVPADAVIIDGSSDFDEYVLTGELSAINRRKDDLILCGSTNGEAAVTARVVRSAGDSQYAQIARILDSSNEYRAPFLRLADRYSILFTVTALTIGAVAAILSREPIRFLDVVVVASPYLLIVTPGIAVLAGLGRAARGGVISKTGAAFELLTRVKTFAFNKTGILTYGQPVLQEIVAFKPYRKDDLLSWAAAIEQNSDYSLAPAVVAAAAKRSLKLAKVKHVQTLAGYGLQTHIQGKDIMVGKFSLLAEHAVKLPDGFKPQTIDHTALCVVIDGALAGYLTFTDEVRQEAKTTLKMLTKLKVPSTMLLTSDHERAGRAITKQLSIRSVIADLLPNNKLRAIEEIQDRPVALVGDGATDASALMAADVGMAFGARGDVVAGESADVIIMKNDLRDIARAVSYARGTFRIAARSIVFGVGLSVILMLLFASGTFSPLMGVAAQAILIIAITLYALRAHNLKTTDL